MPCKLSNRPSVHPQFFMIQFSSTLRQASSLEKITAPPRNRAYIARAHTAKVNTRPFRTPLNKPFRTPLNKPFSMSSSMPPTMPPTMPLTMPLLPESRTDAGASPVSPAQYDVLNNYELHEHILLDLDMKTLLLSQRVSRDWKAIINYSKPLQRKLFFEPATAKQLTELNLVEERGIPGSTKTHNVWLMGDGDVSEDDGKWPWELVVHNPLLMQARTRRDMMHRYIQHSLHLLSVYPEDTIWKRKFWTTHLRKLRGRFELFDGKRSQPSWERMLLVQPVQPKIKVTINDQHGLKLERDFDGRLKFKEFLAAAEKYALQRFVRRSRPVVLFSRNQEYCNTDLTLRGSQATVEEVLTLGLGASEKDSENWNKLLLPEGEGFGFPRKNC